jgi:hypothetical protein
MLRSSPRQKGKSVVALCGTIAIACGAPDDSLFVAQPQPPLEIASGLYRVTWNAGPDVVRGFSPDGQRIVYQSRGLYGFGAEWHVLTVRVDDGSVREEAAVYRLGLADSVGHVVVGSVNRLLVTWRSVPDGVITCEACPPPPPVIDLAIRRLPLTDAAPIATLPTRAVPLPNHRSSDTTCGPDPFPNGFHRIRLRPVEHEVLERRTNPFGPVERADGTAGFYSDGEAVWRYDPADPAAAPDSIGPGAFPALSSDGLTLAAAVPLGLDSTSASCASGLCPCRQETVTVTTTGWEVRLYDLAAGTSSPLGPGLEPAFDPLEPRLAVRRPDALYWMDLATGGANPIPGTDGGYAPAVSPDGALLAFTAPRFDNADVFFVRLR